MPENANLSIVYQQFIDIRSSYFSANITDETDPFLRSNIAGVFQFVIA